MTFRPGNPIESTFGTIRHRTRRSKGCLSRDGMLHMMFKLGQCAEKKWRRLRGFDYLTKVITRVNFKDGVEVANIEYLSEPPLVPPLEMMRKYRDGVLRWVDYKADYYALLSERQVETQLDLEIFNNACLLCSEPMANKCHRRLSAEYLVGPKKGHFGVRFDLGRTKITTPPAAAKIFS